MVEQLTVKKLIEYGFSTEQIKRLKDWDKHEMFLLFGDRNFWASNQENKIYSGTDALRKYYFKDDDNLAFPLHDLNLIDEYYQIKLAAYLKKNKAIAGKHFIENAVSDRFKQIEIQLTKNTIKNLNIKERKTNPDTNEIEKYNVYLDWLNNLDKEESSSKNYSKIFENKSYPILSSLYDYLYKHTPFSKMEEYEKKQYYLQNFIGEINSEQVLEDQAVKDVKRLTGYFKSSFIRRQAQHDYYFIKKLKKERDIQGHKIEMINNNERPFIIWYNGEVVDVIDSYCNRILITLSSIFCDYFQQPEIDNLNIRTNFRDWYKEFNLNGPITKLNIAEEIKDELPLLIGFDLSDVKNKLLTFGSGQESVIFLKSVIGQTKIEQGLKLWEQNCTKVVSQYQKYPAWQGVFAAIHNEFDVSKAYNKDAYEMGYNYYHDYLSLFKLLELVKAGKYEAQDGEAETKNDFTISTIEDWLFQFKEKMSLTDYNSLISSLKHYFDSGKFPILSKEIQINGRVNKKLFGWNLNRIFEAKGKGITKDLLQFAKQNISLFADVQFDEKNYLKSNLYKYFTTKTE